MVVPGGVIWFLVELGQAGNLLCLTGAGDTAHVCHHQRIFKLQTVPLVGSIFKAGSVVLMMLAISSNTDWKGPKEDLVYEEMPM